jgi:ribosome-binding factor A
MNLKQMKEVVKQLKGASKMHAQQAAKIERMKFVPNTPAARVRNA